MKGISLFLLLGLASSPLWAQPTLSLAQQRQLDSIATADVPPGAPGVATAVLREGQVIYQKVAGYADLSDSLRIDAGTRFNYCSNAKQFTALAVLLLAEQGKLHLEQDLRDFLPELYPAQPAPLTLRHLLTHRSGIRDVYDLWALQGKTWWKQSYTNADAVALLRQQQDLNFPPGSQYLYSNSNYILLAEVVAQVAGQPFTAYTRGMFDRLGMTATGFVGPESPPPGQLARPYFNFDTWQTYPWTWQVQGDGNLFTSLQDQLTWEKWVQQPASAPISAEVLRQSQALSELPGADTYGFGLEFGRYAGQPYRFHEGSTGAWKATFMRFSDEKLAIVTLVNTGKTSSSYISRQMADYLLPRPADEPETAPTPESEGAAVPTASLTGVYLAESGRFWFELLASDQPDEVILRREGRSDTRLVRASAHVFHQWNDPSFQQAFRRNAQGELTLTAYHPSHAPYTLTRPEVNWAGFEPASLAGSYQNAELGVDLQLSLLGERRFEVRWADQTRQGQLIAPDRMLVGNYDLTLAEDALYLSGDRIRKVKFSRVMKE